MKRKKKIRSKAELRKAILRSIKKFGDAGGLKAKMLQEVC